MAIVSAVNLAADCCFSNKAERITHHLFTGKYPILSVHLEKRVHLETEEEAKIGKMLAN